MGEPGVPASDDRREALKLAERILDAIRNDEPMLPEVLKETPLDDRLDWVRLDVRQAQELIRVLWLLASTLVYLAERYPDFAPDSP